MCSSYIIFQLTKNLKWDAIIGEYSYPIYITHMMVIDLLKLFGVHKQEQTALTLLITLALSFLLIRLVALPVERMRQRRFDSSSINTF